MSFIAGIFVGMMMIFVAAIVATLMLLAMGTGAYGAVKDLRVKETSAESNAQPA